VIINPSGGGGGAKELVTAGTVAEYYCTPKECEASKDCRKAETRFFHWVCARKVGGTRAREGQQGGRRLRGRQGEGEEEEEEEEGAGVVDSLVYIVGGGCALKSADLWCSCDINKYCGVGKLELKARALFLTSPSHRSSAREREGERSKEGGGRE
jgi:hypothetical protein